MPRWTVIERLAAPGCADGPSRPLQSRAADESDTSVAPGSESAAAKLAVDEHFRAGSGTRR